MQPVVEIFRQREQATNLSTHTPEPSRRFNYICYNDDDDKESIIPLKEIISQLPLSIAITPVLPTMEPKDSLIMEDENLNTIPEKEPDEVIKSSVENLVPIPSESEDTSKNDREYDLPFCGNYVTFPNPLFDANDDFTSSDDESLLEEDVQEENFKTYSNPLFEFDDKYISSDINPLFNEVLEDIESKDSYGVILLLEKLLNDDISFPLPPKELHFEGLKVIKSYIPPDFKDDYFDSEGDTIYLKSLLINDTIPNLPLEMFLDHDPRSLKDEPDNNYLKSMVKVFDPGIHEKIISPTNVRLPFKDRHYFSLTFVIRIFLPFLAYLVNSLLLSSRSEDTIFDPGISAYSFYSLEPVACENPMMIFHSYISAPKTKEFGVSQARDSHKNKRFSGGNPYFYLLFLFSNKCDVRRLASSFLVFHGLFFMFRIAPDYEDSRARGFVHRSLKLRSLTCLYMGIQYPRSY
ncbi:hypothetical protein Tco_1364674 [Tanacetum coccineum]